MSAELHVLVWRCLGDTRDRTVPAVEDGDVLGHGDLMRGIVERLQVGVVGATVGVAQLGPRELEVGAQLDHRQDASLQSGDALARRCSSGPVRPRFVGRVLPTVRPGEVDELACGERRGQALARLLSSSSQPSLLIGACERSRWLIARPP